MSRDPNAAGLGINWHVFGSNGQETADYSLGVLERFTRRAPNDWSTNQHVKTIADPRKINLLQSPHLPNYFEGFYSINENDGIVNSPFNAPVTANKIIINHYHCKSREEYRFRKSFFLAQGESFDRFEKQFEAHDRNEEFDDGILKYLDERAKNFKLPDKSHAVERLLNALMKNLSPTLTNAPQDFYVGKVETFLTCRAVAAYLQTKLTDEAPAKFFEEASLAAILKSLENVTVADAQLFIRELPNLLSLPYPVVEELRGACLHIVPQIMNIMQLNNRWQDYVELDYLQSLLKLI